MSIDPAVQGVIDYIAGLTDEKERNRVLSQIKLKAANKAPDAAFQPDVRSLRDYLNTEIEIPPSLVWPTIAIRGEVTTTLGRAGKGKTTMNLNRILSWSAGQAMFPGWKDKDGVEYLAPTQPLRTLVAENEGNAGMFHQKVGIMLNNGPLNDDQKEMARDNIFVHGDGGYSGLKLDGEYDTSPGVIKLRKSIEFAKPDIVFIEPFRSLWRGEENSATDMNAVVDNIIKMATEYDCAIILSHHERKSGAGDDGEKMSAGRGSTVLEGAVAVMENFESVKGGEFRELSWSKSRYLPPPPPVRMSYKAESIWYDWVPQNSIDDGIIVALREADGDPLNMASLVEQLDESKAKLRDRLKILVADGKIKTEQSISNGQGSTGLRYRLSSADNEGKGLEV